MDEFQRIVKRACAKHENRMISNASIEHAAILIRALLVDAQRNAKPVRMVTGNLSASFYGPLAPLATKVMKAGGTVEIIIEDAGAQLEGNLFYDAVQAHPRGAVMRLNDGVYESVSHFVVSGDCCYRLETDHKASEAIANFGDTDLAATLIHAFNSLKESSQVVLKPDATAVGTGEVAVA